MSKIEMFGPKNLLVPVLETIQRSALVQVDGQIQPRLIEGPETELRPLAVSAVTRERRAFYVDLDRRTARLLTLLPSAPLRTSYLTPESAIQAVAAHVDRRTAWCEERVRRQEALREGISRVQQTLGFLKTVATLVAQRSADGLDRDYIAVALKDDTALTRLRQAVARLPHYPELRTTHTPDGSYIGLLTTERGSGDTLKDALRQDWIPEVALPADLEGRPLADKLTALQQRLDELSAEAVTVAAQLQRFAATWRGLYEQVHHWLQTRLAVLDAGTEAFATERCFVIFGWTPTKCVAPLTAALARQHGPYVVVHEQPILDCDLPHVPVSLENRGYFKPYELLVSLLPPPRYTSFDPTPFIALFFPFFFGVILGDCGYGAVLLAVALLASSKRAPRVVEDAGRILTAGSLWSIAFGFVYGECFGELGAHALGLKPLLDRRVAIMPTLYFAISLGAAHVVLGLVLGFLTSRKSHQRRESVFRFVSIVTMLCVISGFATYLDPSAAWLRPMFFASAAVTVPLLVITGGLLAPLEFVRHLGNVVSYARLMAVGLASVLLAYVANDLAAHSGSVWLGVAIAVLLHTFNLILGVFAPTIHALRLHYVEFFSKFFEPGAKRFRPLRQVD